jgi:hypothetical protein
VSGRAHRPALLARAGQAWRFRCGVEREAHARFARLAGWLHWAGFPGALCDLALRASFDERRHAALCEGLATGLEASPADLPAATPEVLAPAGLSPGATVLYEAVAACCVTETGSVGVLTALLGEVRGGRMRRVLRELAADEVGHSRLGWAVLAAEPDRGAAAALSPWVPAMLSGSIEAGLFQPGPPEDEDDALLEFGVLPRALRREVFVRTTLDVVLPGLSEGGVDPEPGRRWLLARLRAAGQGGPGS